jgi:hypothetical protein
VVLVVEGGDDRDWRLARDLRDAPRSRDVPVVILTSAVRADTASRRIVGRLGNCSAPVAKRCDPQVENHCEAGDIGASETVTRFDRGERS